MTDLMPRSLRKARARIGIVAFAGEELFDARDQADAVFRHHAIGGVSWREDERPGAAKFVADRVDLAVAAAFRRPDRLKIRPPFPPLAQRWIDMAAVQRNLLGHFAGTHDACKYLLPNAFLTPTGKAVVDGLVRTKFSGAILPTATNLQHMHDPA